MDSAAKQHQQFLHSDAESSWTIALLALAVIGLFLLLFPYFGITHDAQLYSLQALNHLHPDLYANDVFLRYGSQDDYTFFTPLYAAIIAWLGLEPAAALLTFLSQLAFLAAAGLLTQKLMPARLALAALALLLLLPTHYGAQKIFSCFEGFVTPRLFAESLVLFAVSTWLEKRHLLSVALLMGAMLTHPIMGLSGVALLATATLIIPHWRRWWLLVLPALIAIGTMAVIGTVPADWRLDDEWLAIVLTRAEYLWLGSWSIDEWGRVTTLAGTLAIEAWCLRGDMQRLAIAVFFSTGASMLLALIGGDLMRISIVIQAQPWRALWLATVISILLLPPLFIQCWQEAPLRRCGMALLAAAWLSPSENIGLLIAPVALVAMCWRNSDSYDRRLRLLLLGAYAILAIIIVDATAVSLLTWRTGTYGFAVSPVLDVLRSVSTGGAIPLIVLLASCRMVKFTRRPARPVLTVILVLLVAAVAVPTLKTWLNVRYDSDLKAAFAEWRSRIPPGSDVMWAADGTAVGKNDSATSTWLLLERPSYVSRIQGTTSLFSRQAALEMRDRIQSIRGLLPDIGSLYPKNAKISIPEPLTLSRVCQSSSVKYIVTQASFIDATPILAPAQIRIPFRNLKLYICP
jgi:hypothetical protein